MNTMEIDNNLMSPTGPEFMDEDHDNEAINPNPIAALIDGLKDEQKSLRLDAVKQLSTIAEALGPERTRDELIPFLQDPLDDDDEVLGEIAIQLGELRNTAGSSHFAGCLLSLLEIIASNEDLAIRDKAISSLCELAKTLPEKQLEEDFMPLLKRLSEGEWPNSRAAATGLYATVYEKYPNVRNDLTSMFEKLVDDESPLVRRSTAKVLGEFAGKVPQESGVLQTIIPLFQKLAQDDQDSVRVLAATALKDLIKLLTEQHRRDALLPTFSALTSDKSWRIRYEIASNYVEISHAFGTTIAQEYCTVPFTELLQDPEGEVRTAAASKIPGYARLINDKKTICDTLLPRVQELAKDQSQHARAALAKEIIDLAPIVGKEITLEKLLPVFLEQLKDEFSDVRLNIIKKLEVINKVIEEEKLSEAVIPAIEELAEDTFWRIRKAIIDHIHLLAKQFDAEFFEDKLLKLCMSWLKDGVYDIREAAVENLKKLAEVFGPEWAKTHIVGPLITDLKESGADYRSRMVTLSALTSVAEALKPEIIKDDVLPIIKGLSKDPIPNIRFNVAKSLEILIPLLKKDPKTSESVTNDVIPVLQELSEKDEDGDVRYFAKRALEG